MDERYIEWQTAAVTEGAAEWVIIDSAGEKDFRWRKEYLYSLDDIEDVITSRIRCQAIDAGVAEYVVTNSFGAVEFRWMKPVISFENMKAEPMEEIEEVRSHLIDDSPLVYD